jgi:HPt (histidine-containing phosphotransfer) domain-containing protein
MPDSPKNPRDTNDDTALTGVLSHDAELWAMAEQFIRTLPERVRAMREALHAGSHERLRSVAHHLKASGAHLGYKGISDRAAQIEQAAHDHVIDGLSVQIDELTALIAHVQSIKKKD